LGASYPKGIYDCSFTALRVQLFPNQEFIGVVEVECSGR